MGITARIKGFLFVSLRIWKYRILSDCKRVAGNPDLLFPLLLKGKGKVSIGKNFQNGVIASSYYYSRHNYILALNETSEVIIGDNVIFSNGMSIVAETKIIIEDNVMIGLDCFLIDTDGHDLSPEKRMTGVGKTAPITIKKNVAIYYNCIILKGVTIGENSVIGSGSIVTKDIPPNVFAAGNPARVIRNL